MLRKAAAFFARESEGALSAVFAFIAAEKATYPISLMCLVLSVNRTSFHAWGAPSAVRPRLV